MRANGHGEEKKIICPFCGYYMPVFVTDDAQAHGVYIRCKGRNCGQWIEIKVRDGRQKV